MVSNNVPKRDFLRARPTLMYHFMILSGSLSDIYIYIATFSGSLSKLVSCLFLLLQACLFKLSLPAAPPGQKRSDKQIAAQPLPEEFQNLLLQLVQGNKTENQRLVSQNADGVAALREFLVQTDVAISRTWADVFGAQPTPGVVKRLCMCVGAKLPTAPCGYTNVAEFKLLGIDLVLSLTLVTERMLQ